jgi:HSP20 family protein
MATADSRDDKQRESTSAAQGASPQGGMQRSRESGSEGRESTLSQRGGFPARSSWGLSPWEPWSFRRIFEDFDRMFDEMRREFFGTRFFEGGPMAQRSGAGGINWMPRLDVEDTGRELVIQAELPGVDPKDVNVECTEDGLTITGERREERSEAQGGYRSYGRFFRQIPVPAGCDMDKADASFKNGLLRIRLPKAQPENVRRIPINTQGERSAEGGQGAGSGHRPEGGQRAA